MKRENEVEDYFADHDARAEDGLEGDN